MFSDVFGGHNGLLRENAEVNPGLATTQSQHHLLFRSALAQSWRLFKIDMVLNSTRYGSGWALKSKGMLCRPATRRRTHNIHIPFCMFKIQPV